MFTDEQVAAYIQDNKLTDEQAQEAAAVYGVSPEQLARAQKLLDVSGQMNAAVWSPGGIKLEPAESEKIIQKLYDQISSQGTQSQWTGEGFGSVEANIRDMARILADAGITDINQFGAKTVEIPERYEQVEGESGPIEYFVPASQKQVFFNKETGQEIAPNYAKAQGNIWSGTFAGKGSTGYGVQFDEQGNPYFYTQYGGTSSDWVAFRDAIKGIANTIGMFTPAAPYIAAANAANFAKKGEWEKAILAALPAAGKIAGQVGAAADTVSTINEANKFAKILKSLDDGNLLSAAFQGADLAGVSDVLGYDINDVKKVVNLGMAVKGVDENPMALFQAATAFAPQSGSGKADAGYQMTTDFGSGANYQLFPDSDYQGLGLKVPTDLPDVFNPDGSINYDLFDFNQFGEPIGLKMPKSPNIDIMGGGQGLRLPVDGGYITEAGFIPEGYTPDLGDPESFINKPAPGADVSDAVKKALDASAKAGEKKPSPQGSPDLSSLIAMSGGRQGPIPLVVPENAADIKLMDEIFGTSLSAPSTGNDQDRATALARLLRS